MDPIEYLVYYKEDIEINLVDENPQCYWNVDQVISALTDIINELTPRRHLTKKTKQIINNSLSTIPLGEKSFVKHWLRKALGEDQSYAHSYNYLTQAFNRETGFGVPLTDTSNLVEKLKTTVLDDNENSKNKDFTTARQVLAMYYLSDHLGIWRNTDKSNIENFTHFLTSKNRDEIHKKFINPVDNKKANNRKKEDYIFVMKYFEDLGLRSIVEKMKRDID